MVEVVFVLEFTKHVYPEGSVALLLVAILVMLAAVSWVAPKVGDRWLRPLEKCAARFARRKSLTLLSLAIATILIRLALLPVLPVPIPAIHDEFSYLLAADTFAHGRLTNPPHPMWIFFDTFHVLQHPTYASKYPPGQSVPMALGQILGHPWIGVLLTMAATVAAMTWMLQGWFSPPWALLGGVLVLAYLVLFQYWVDSYYNGSVATIGATLVLGAFPRILTFGRARDSLLMGAGAVILASSRPVEGFIFCIPPAVALSAHLLFRLGPHRKGRILRIVLPFSAVLISGLLFLAYYNAKVTGNPLKFPYAIYQREYTNYPIFAWQKLPPPLRYDNPQFESFFNGWQREDYPLTWNGWKERTFEASWLWWYLFLGTILTLPFIMLPRVLRDRRMRLPLCQFALCAIGLVSVVWFQPHYAAPLAATLYVLLVQAMRHLRQLEIKGRAMGIFLSRLVVVLAIDWVVAQAGHAARFPIVGWNARRQQIIDTLDSLPGQHLVLVRYAPDHNVHCEWVYNAAEIDRAKIVWAREIPGQDLRPLLDYFKDRKTWIVRPDASPPRLEPYAPTGSP